jgi:hypothetical protein
VLVILLSILFQCLQVAAASTNGSGWGKGKARHGLGRRCVRWWFSWALALSRQGSQHQQVIHANIRKSSLAKFTDFTPLMAVVEEGRTVPCHYTGNECTLKLGTAGSAKTLVPAYQTNMAAYHRTQQLSFSMPRESQILKYIASLPKGCYTV